jgi:hypothetical protein
VSLEPTEAELLREAIASALTDVHTSIPARVVSYDAATQTADCEIVILRAEQGESGATVHETYPIVPNVPVGWPSGGGYSLQFQLEAGDGVWLVFSEAAIAQWRETGDISPPGDLDRFDISYPIALPCARHSGQPLPEAMGAMLKAPGNVAAEHPLTIEGLINLLVLLLPVANPLVFANPAAADAAIATALTAASASGGWNVATSSQAALAAVLTSQPLKSGTLPSGLTATPGVCVTGVQVG